MTPASKSVILELLSSRVALNAKLLRVLEASKTARLDEGYVGRVAKLRSTLEREREALAEAKEIQ